jgi:hypothetical protein
VHGIVHVDTATWLRPDAEVAGVFFGDERRNGMKITLTGKEIAEILSEHLFRKYKKGSVWSVVIFTERKDGKRIWGADCELKDEEPAPSK